MSTQEHTGESKVGRLRRLVGELVCPPPELVDAAEDVILFGEYWHEAAQVKQKKLGLLGVLLDSTVDALDDGMTGLTYSHAGRRLRDEALQDVARCRVVDEPGGEGGADGS